MSGLFRGPEGIGGMFGAMGLEGIAGEGFNPVMLVALAGWSVVEGLVMRVVRKFDQGGVRHGDTGWFRISSNEQESVLDGWMVGADASTRFQMSADRYEGGAVTRRPATVAMFVLVVLLTACGGAGDGGPVTTSPAGPTEASPPDAAVDPTTQTTVGDDSAMSGENEAVVTVGGQSYTFAVVDDRGSCDPDFFGNYRAILIRVDDAGEPIEMEGETGITQGITISLAHDGSAAFVMGNFGGMVWTAGDANDVDSAIDSFSLDGGSAEGILTFVNSDGEAMEGTFEVVCAQG